MFKLHSLAILLIFLLNISFLYSQSADEYLISINYKTTDLKTILEDIEEQTNLFFTYSNKKIDDQQIVTIIARNKSLNVVLEQLFNQLNITYTIIEKQIVLVPEIIEKEQEIPVIPDINKYSISGILRDKETGEYLIGATVYVNNSIFGTITNEYGYYSLTLEEGIYNIVFSYIGYFQQVEEVFLSKNIDLNKELELNEISINLIVISKESGRDILELNPLKNMKFDPEKYKNKTGFSGEADLVKTIRSIPGVNFFGDGSGYFYTRGGGRSQNLIFIDEAPVYNPAHLLGFVPAIAPEAINEINFYKNDFPIKYGNALSSFTEIYLKEGNKQKQCFSAILNPISSSFSIDGPIKKEKHSFIVTVRKSNINWLLASKFADTKVDFLDFHAKLNFQINKNRRLYFSFYTSNDEIKLTKNLENQQSIKWQNVNFSIRLNKIYNNRAFSNFSLIASNYDYYLFTNLNNSVYWNSNIGNLCLKYDFYFYHNSKIKHRIGYNLNTYVFNPGNFDDEYFTQTIKTGDVREPVVYYGNEIKFNDKFLLSFNFRGSLWNNIGTAKVYTYDEQNQRIDTVLYEKKQKFNTTINFEPRISLSYSLSKKSLFKISFDKTIQNIHQLSNSTSPFTTLDVWFPTGINLKSEKANQFVFAFYYKFPELEFYINYYYKFLKNQIEYGEHANMLLNPLIELQIKKGYIKSSGIEFYISKPKGDFNFDLSYTYSRVKRFTPEINNNSIYYADYDKPHNFFIEMSYNLQTFWKISADWIFSSGSRYSKPQGFYYFQNYTVPIYSEKNNAKLPDYHRLDLNITFYLNKKSNKRLKHNIIIAIYNLYSRKNIMSINYNKIESETGEFYIPVNYYSINENVTTKIWLSEIMPVLSYAINF